jgi:hypothetical protein
MWPRGTYVQSFRSVALAVTKRAVFTDDDRMWSHQLTYGELKRITRINGHHKTVVSQSNISRNADPGLTLNTTRMRGLDLSAVCQHPSLNDSWNMNLFLWHQTEIMTCVGVWIVMKSFERYIVCVSNHANLYLWINSPDCGINTLNLIFLSQKHLLLVIIYIKQHFSLKATHWPHLAATCS